MIITLSIGLSSLASFHSLTHALFKALLFMCAGDVTHITLGKPLGKHFFEKNGRIHTDGF